MKSKQCFFTFCLLFHFWGLAVSQDLPENFPHLPFHLTARPWTASSLEKSDYLKVLEEVCHVMAKHQDQNGAIIDPFLRREHQYSTPYFAYTVGTLLSVGKASHLKASGIMAMENATAALAGGYAKIPDAHGEFFISPLSEGLKLYKDFVSEKQYQEWEKRMQTPISEIMENQEGRINNWRTYAMKGEWNRVKNGFAAKSSATDFIENAWNEKSQRLRIIPDKWSMYQDWSSDPQSLAVEAVGRGNLIGLTLDGYDGPAASEIKKAVRKGTAITLLLQAPDGQAPSNGRTDNHVFNDVLYLLGFEAMAEDALQMGDSLLAGRYRRGAYLAFQSIKRWQREDGDWKGSFFVTKNFFDPADRIGYQPASQWGNYTGAIAYHLAEAFHVRQSMVKEVPSPTEIGGYAFTTDPAFSTFTANAGGMQVVVNLRGASVPKYGLSWTPLGVNRFSRVNWDARLGPSDGEHDLKGQTASGEFQSGVTFGPEWKIDGQWVRISDLPRDYRVIPEVEFVHPLLVKFKLLYTYVTGMGGPYFSQEFTVTPDGIMTRLKSLQNIPFGLTVPLLENDGRPLINNITDRIASTAYDKNGDEQNFISLNSNLVINKDSPAIQSTYGWLKPLRFQTDSLSNDVFIYPRNSSEPHAKEFLDSFQWLENGFSSILGTVSGNLYIGRTSAGGEGRALDINGNGEIDVQFDQLCRFILQLEEGKVVHAEADRKVKMIYRNKEYLLTPFQPLPID
ncbi:hypothetical protein [Aquiflexum sp.]|uniref:hypothetical protein n=1 Tax=Aquiflexum sp. TaxID=1872584 RepID=UPI0035937D17